MSTLPAEDRTTARPSRSARKVTPRDTELLKVVPEPREVRERIRRRSAELAGSLDKVRALAKHEIETYSRTVLEELGLPKAYAGWTMVALASAFWGDEVVRIPHSRRLLLLPRCLRKAETCPAKTNELGLLCENCGACALAELKDEAEAAGYRVLIAEGTPIVMQMILAGQADAILGVGCLNVLEKALDKILLAGLPCMAVPLLVSTCRNTSTDVDWVREMIATPYRPGAGKTRTHVHLLRCAAGMFEPEEFARLMPPTRSEATPGDGHSGIDPLAATETVARDFVLRGGKHYRPFITLAAYDAMTGARALGPDGAEGVANLPDAVKRVAVAIELFHKASLVHDDIEDDDPDRYGRPTVHRQHGVPVAINVGDYLIGLGYRLVAEQRAPLGGEAVGDVLARLSQAHAKLCEGQGAELAWRQSRGRSLSPLEILTIYALKTAPAFEAALYAGLRIAGRTDTYGEPAARFSRHLGVGYQVLDDLDDWGQPWMGVWAGDGTFRPRRPTILSALAYDGLEGPDRRELDTLVNHGPADDDDGAARLGELYARAGVREKALSLVDKHRRRAREVADAVEHPELRRLLHYFIDTILHRSWSG